MQIGIPEAHRAFITSLEEADRTSASSISKDQIEEAIGKLEAEPNAGNAVVAQAYLDKYKQKMSPEANQAMQAFVARSKEVSAGLSPLGAMISGRNGSATPAALSLGARPVGKSNALNIRLGAHTQANKGVIKRYEAELFDTPVKTRIAVDVGITKKKKPDLDNIKITMELADGKQIHLGKEAVMFSTVAENVSPPHYMKNFPQKALVLSFDSMAATMELCQHGVNKMLDFPNVAIFPDTQLIQIFPTGAEAGSPKGEWKEVQAEKVNKPLFD